LPGDGAAEIEADGQAEDESKKRSAPYHQREKPDRCRQFGPAFRHQFQFPATETFRLVEQGVVERTNVFDSLRKRFRALALPFQFDDLILGLLVLRLQGDDLVQHAAPLGAAGELPHGGDDLAETAPVGLQVVQVIFPQIGIKQNAPIVGDLIAQLEAQPACAFDQLLVDVDEPVVGRLYPVERIKADEYHDRQQRQHDGVAADNFPADSHGPVSF